MLVEHYFQHKLVNLHYYEFGTGNKTMLCFHGYGMHGKQFKSLEDRFGTKYTFYGFDLFFHKKTKLADQSLEVVKKGISKSELAGLILDFCTYEKIERFSVIGYSMGTHYATAVVEELATMIDEYIVVAPSCLNPGWVVRYLSTNALGNKLLEYLVFNEKLLIGSLQMLKKLKFVDSKGHDIMLKEIANEELRFNLYACFTYLRFLDTNTAKLLEVIQKNQVKSIFMFGLRDKMYPQKIGNKIFKKMVNPRIILLDKDHEMINDTFASSLADVLL